MVYSSLVTAHGSIPTSPTDTDFTFVWWGWPREWEVSVARAPVPLDCAMFMLEGIGRVPLQPGHIPSWNSSISLPGMKVNTPAKSFLDKTYLPRARGSTCPCQWPGMQTGGGSRVRDMAVTRGAAASSTPQLLSRY